MPRRLLALTATLALFGLGPAANAAPRVDPRIAEVFRRQSRQVVLVELADRGEHAGPSSLSVERFAPPHALATLAPFAGAQARVLARLLKSSGVEPRRVRAYQHFPMLALEVAPRELAALAAMGEVTHLWASRSGRPLLTSSLPFAGITAFQDTGFKGQGTSVAIADLAVAYWNDDFGTCPKQTDAWADNTPGCALIAWKSFNAWPAAPDDEAQNDPKQVAAGEDHGTHVAAIVHGVAPQATLVGLNIFSWSTAEGTWLARTEDTVAALDWAAENAQALNLVAVNLSVGWDHANADPCNDSEFFAPVRALWDKGVVVTVASGNDAALDWLNSPACVNLTLSVGAQYDTDLAPMGGCGQDDPHVGEIACISNLSGMLDFVAPGMDITAAGITKSGTSMAAPHVAGAVALLQSRWLAQEGAKKSAAWAREQLTLQSGPRPHDGRVFHQLALGDGPRYSLGAAFPWFAREAPEAAIPKSPSSLEEKLVVASQGGQVASAYLHLELDHPKPEHLKVTIAGPGGATLTVQLPAAGPQLNATLGRDYLPGVLLPLAGSPVDGEWSLRLEDTTDDGLGHYLWATLFLVATPCAPTCGDKACGDDLCGGDCGSCASSERCSTNRLCVACTPDCGGRKCGPDRCGASCGSCDDGVFCNGTETCQAGACAKAAAECSQKLACGSLTCDEAAHACTGSATVADTCLIDQACYKAGAANPANPCQKCDPASHTTSWTDLTGPCDDEDPCTTGDTCQSGRCLGTAKDCSAVAHECQRGVCDSVTGECAALVLPDGSACEATKHCSSTGACQAGVCVAASQQCVAVTAGCSSAGGSACPEVAIILALLTVAWRARRAG